MEAEGEVGGLEADLEAVALRAAEAETALEPRSRPDTPSVQQLRALTVGRGETEFYTSAQQSARAELGREVRQSKRRAVLSACLYY